MSQTPPPPPPTGPPPPPDDPNQPPLKTPAEQIKPPAIALLIFGIVGVVLAAVAVAIYILSVGATNAQGPGQANAFVFGGGMANVVGAIIGVIGGVFVIYGSLSMQKLESYGISMAAAIVALVPFVSPCCFLGIPFGIWALVVLNKAEVKAAFEH